MPPVLSADHARLLHLRAQGLYPPAWDARTGVAQVVRACGGVQAQEALAGALAVRARGTGQTLSAVERARLEERSIVRTWAMRGTLHLVATEDLGWLLALFGPIFIPANRRRRAALGLDEDTCARGVRVLRDVLARQGPLTRAEIVSALAGYGITLIGQAAPHLLGYAALQGVICYGPDRAGEPTYVLLAGWADPGPPLPREAALAALARRYLAAYGPAGPDDLTAWSGLPRADVRVGWQGSAHAVLEVKVAGRPAWMLRERAAWLDDLDAASLSVRLLPGFDTYLLGYRDRALVVAPAHARRVHPGGGIIHPTLLVDSQVRGTWRRVRRKADLDIVVEPFADLAPAVHVALAAEAADVARFLETRGGELIIKPSPS